MRQTRLQRWAAIIEIAANSGHGSVEELAEHFGVTASTIRRDLADLMAEGRIARTYGGLIPITAVEQTLQQRFGQAHDEKTRIAQAAYGYIADDSSIFLDAGTTVAALAEKIKDSSRLTVITASIAVLNVLSSSEKIRLECLGGTLRRISQGFVGPLTVEAISRFRFDASFVGTDGVSLDGEICEADQDQIHLKRSIFERSDHVYVLADGSKIGQRPYSSTFSPRGKWTLVTDSSAPEDILRKIRNSGVSVIVS